MFQDGESSSLAAKTKTDKANFPITAFETLRQIEIMATGLFCSDDLKIGRETDAYVVIVTRPI